MASQLISELPEQERPREKAMRYGLKSLSDAELMAIIFSTGIKGKSVLDMCREILDDHKGHLSTIATMSCREFTEHYKGIGPAKALTLLAALELGVRAGADALKMEHTIIRSSEDSYIYMREHFYGLDHEQFWILLLRTNNEPIKAVEIGRGGLSNTAVDVRIIMREALLARAGGIIACHNHPSGNLQPSTQDISLTKRIKDAADLFGIRLLDHLIFTDSTFYSFNDNGRL